MKSLLSTLAALVMVCSILSRPAFVPKAERGDPNTGFAVATADPPLTEFVQETGSPELPSRQKTPVCEPVAPSRQSTEETCAPEGTISQEPDPVPCPPDNEPAPISDEETQPPEETIAQEPDPVPCPPDNEPAPISDEETQPPEETIALEADPVPCPPDNEPAPISDEETQPPEETIAIEFPPVADPPDEAP